ncbi:MAG: NAD(P)-binding domain-containing protein [Chloroflexota bacterium]
MERTDALVVGGGSAGLSVSHELTRLGIDHVVVERGRIGQAWRDRWDSFCLVTPNWSVRLPGGAYDGEDPDGFMPKDDIAEHLERYATSFDAPVREGVDVEAVTTAPGSFAARTSDGEFRAHAVIAASGTFGRPHRPAEASAFPARLTVLDITSYTSPEALPPGRVLVVGSGQSGCQVAEELHEAGRDVVLSCGRAPWTTRRIGDRDMFWWLQETGFLGQTLAQLPSPAARLNSNPLTSGHGGGHDLHLRTLRAMGVTLVGRFKGLASGYAHFEPDLAQSVAWGDARWADFSAQVRRVADRLGTPAPDLAEPEPFDPDSPEKIPVGDLAVVLFTGGFRPAYSDWLPWPHAFDETGFPIQTDGASTVVDGLFFVGTHFLRTRGSSILAGVGEDARVVAEQVASKVSR